MGLLAAHVVAAPSALHVPYEDAAPILDTLRDDLLPLPLRATHAARRPSVWPSWVAARNRDIRARLEQGDRDSVANFLIFGTSFTKQSRPSGDDFGALEERPSRVTALLAARLDDLVRAVAAPGQNERLHIARALLERAGIDPSSPGGRAQARAYLLEGLTQGPTSLTTYAQAVSAPGGPDHTPAGSAFRDRGLSSDTSILIHAALDQALAAIRQQGHLRGHAALGAAAPTSTVRRVGIVGPGLDITDKHDGYDFYPLQTIQPFAVVDALLRHELARADDLRVTALDLSPRVIQHVARARARAETGESYTVHLPRNMNLPWSKALTAYWQDFGTRIGERAPSVKVPPEAGNVRVRSVRVRPPIVQTITASDVNIVAERLDLSVDERFDIVIATDVLVYYDVFEQSLALTNIAAMLRPGGLLVTNAQLFELPAIPLEAVGARDIIHMTMPIVGDIRDRVTWYRRR